MPEGENLAEVFDFKMKPFKELFYSEASFYCIAQILTETNLPYSNYDQVAQKYLTTLVGRTLPLDRNREYNVRAKLITNEKYGNQYEIINIEPIYGDATQQDIDNDFLKTLISEKDYNTLVSQYPEIVKNVNDNPNFEPDYTLLKGIKEKKWATIREKIIKFKDMSRILAFLAPLGVTNNTINELVKHEPNFDILKQKLIDNPYQFTEISGFGFMRVDKLALRINPKLRTSSFRVSACIKHVLEQEALNGNLWVSAEEFGRLFMQIIKPSEEGYKECFQHAKDLIQVERKLTADGKNTILRVVDKMIGLKKYYNMEQSIWNHLKRINTAPDFNPLHNPADFADVIKETNDFFSKDDKIVELTSEQINAIENTIDHKVSIITANAGCGKTVCIKGILNLYSGYTVETAALSGKAARRIEESTGVPSSTIHRLLGAQKTPKRIRLYV